MMRPRRATKAARPSPVRIVRELDQPRWADFVLHHPKGTIYHTPQMHEVFARAKHHRPALWAAVDAAGAVRAVMTPVEITTVGGPLRALTTRVVMFSSPLVVAGPDRHAVLAALLDAYRRGHQRAAVFTEIRNLADSGDLAPHLAATGFRHEPHLNFLIDLTPSEEQLWQRVAASARRNIRKARRVGVTITEVEDPDNLAAGYEVLQEAYRRIRVPLPDPSLFDACQEILASRGEFKVLLAHLDGRTIGVLMLLRHKDSALYWYTGTRRTSPPSGAGDLLAWHAIADSRADGYRVLDFGGAGRPDQPYGVRDFKAKYGGELVDFGRDVWPSAPARLRLSTAGYALARRFL